MAKQVNRKRIALFILLAALIGICAGLPWLYTMMSPPPPPPPDKDKPPIIADSDWKDILAVTASKPLGREKAPYTIVEFGDFQCNPCHEIRPYLEAMVKEHPDKVNLMFVNRPLPKAHEFAVPSAEFAMLVSQYKDFWKVYDFLYDHHEDLETGQYVDYAQKFGLTTAQYEDPVKIQAAKDSVQKSKEFSNNHEIKTTPTLIVRDNKTGKLSAFVGLDETKKYCLTQAPWMVDEKAKPATGAANPVLAPPPAAPSGGALQPGGLPGGNLAAPMGGTSAAPGIAPTAPGASPGMSPGAAPEKKSGQ
jgi:protein-disulfide isomerase